MKTELEAEIPDELTISKVTYEGPDLVIYTETPRKFVERNGLIRYLASTVRKRITVRPVPGTQTNSDEAYSRILDVIPDEAGITDFEFYPAIGEVLIEAEKPGLVIGQQARTLREIMQTVGWTPEVLRTPPIESSTVANVRNFLQQAREERQAFLEGVGDQIHREPLHDTDWVRVTTLGCCREERFTYGSYLSQPAGVAM
jgi:predicted metal-dependent RNase